MSVKAVEAEVYIQSGVEADVEIADCSIEADVEIGREIVKTVYVEPTLESLEVVTNGTYEPEEGVDGYSDVTVNVPGKIPVLEQLNAIANGSYFPEEGIDGFDEVIVNVPNAPEKMVASGSFIATVKSTGAVIDTKNTDWTKLIIVPHTLPYAVTAVRSIGVKYIDMSYGETGMCLSQFASNSGSTFNAGGWNNVNIDGGQVFVEDGVVTFATGGNQASVGLFIKDVQYDWYAWSEDALEPEETNIFEGEFEATETGVLTIDIPYTGDEYPKAIVITPVDGLMTDEFLSAAQTSSNYRFVINYYAGFKNNTNTPVYDSEETDSAIRNYLIYMDSSKKYAYTYNTRYPFKSDDPTFGVNALRIPDNRHIKIWCAKNRSGTGTYFWTNVKYRYCVYY